MPHNRYLVATLLPFLTFVAVSQAEDKNERAEPDYRPRVEVQHGDFATARASFKSQLRRFGPAPTAWQDAVVPPEASEITYLSGSLRLKAWLGVPADATKKHPAVLYLHSGFDFSKESWDLVRPFREAGYVVMLPTVRGENGQHGVFTLAD